jgi:hypothetical protein
MDSCVSTAALLGIGLGYAALPKTLAEYYCGPNGIVMSLIWFDISNKRVTNEPSIHKH